MSRLSASFRLMRAGWVLAREGVLSALPSEGLQGPPALAHRFAGIIARRKTKNSERSENISRAMNKLGPSYIKLGQFLATRPDIVGSAVANDLSLLQDQVRGFPYEQSVAQVEGSLGRKINDLFVEFEPAIAAASMGQVHPAFALQSAETIGRMSEPDQSAASDDIAQNNTDADNLENRQTTTQADVSDSSHSNTVSGTKTEPTRKVAVKVMRPGVRQSFTKDLEGFYMVANMQERYVPASRRLRPVSVVDMLAQSARIEMDLRLEAAALSEMAENTKDDKGFRVPEVDWERTGRDVLTMEWIDGTKMSDIEGLRKTGFDLSALATTLMQSFLNHALRDGFFHADMHPGNLFVDNDGCIVAVDLGISGRLGMKERNFLAKILYGFITRDYILVAQAHFDAGYVPHHHDIESFAQANRAIGEPIHGQAAETISMARLLTLLFEVTQIFDMETRPELLLLQKTMVVVEGVSRSLDPQFNMWKAGEPVVKDWIAKNMGPIGVAKDLGKGAQSLLMLARKTPELTQSFLRVTEGFDKMAQNGLHLNNDTLTRFAKAQSRQNRIGRYALIMIAICLAIITFKLF